MWFEPRRPGDPAPPAGEDWNDPLLRETISPAQIEAQVGEPLTKMTPESVERARQNLEAMGANNAMQAPGGRHEDRQRERHRSDAVLHRLDFGHLEFETGSLMGLTPSEAIVAATRDSAESPASIPAWWRRARVADFIVLDANPLENIANSRRINKVYLRGQEVDRAAMKARWQAEFRTAATR